MLHPPSVLVLGASGMLGSAVVHRLRAAHGDWRVDGTDRAPGETHRFQADAGRPGLTALLKLNRYDYAINCIGVLKNAIDERRSETIERAIRVNALFPHELGDVAGERGARVIHISSDAVFSGKLQTPYTEADTPDPIDVYGMTKFLGESPAPNALNIRCSIVGRDRRKRGLVEWYLAATTESVSGFTDYVWTPATTAQVADFCAALILGDFDACRSIGHVVHFAPNPALSKADFLEYLHRIVGTGPSIEARLSPDGPCYRILKSHSQVSPEASLAERSWSAVLPELLAEFSSRGV